MVLSAVVVFAGAAGRSVPDFEAGVQSLVDAAWGVGIFAYGVLVYIYKLGLVKRNHTVRADIVDSRTVKYGSNESRLTTLRFDYDGKEHTAEVKEGNWSGDKMEISIDEADGTIVYCKDERWVWTYRLCLVVGAAIAAYSLYGFFSSAGW